MTVDEFRNEFDLLYNNIMSDMAPGLDDYERSVFLTQAQEELVSQLYSGSGNFNGFEATEQVRRNLANLIEKRTALMQNPTAIGNGYYEYTISLAGLAYSTLVLLAERVELQDSDCCNNKKWVSVVPVKYDELNRVLENPFRRPNNFRVIRVDMGTEMVKIIANSQQAFTYEYECLKRPSPIVLGDFTGTGFSINGRSTPATCALDESLHRPIIRYAVQLAAASWASNNKS